MTKLISNSPKVLVVGSGITGTAVVDTIGRAGFSCTVLEAGPLPFSLAKHRTENLQDYREMLSKLLKISSDNWSFETNNPSYDWIRVRTAGGRSLRWNGWLAIPRYENFIDPISGDWLWPISEKDMQCLWQRALKWLNGTKGTLSPYFVELNNKISDVVIPKVGAISPDGKRPFCSLDKFIPDNRSYNNLVSNIELIYNRVVTKLLFENEKVVGVESIDTSSLTKHVYKSDIIVLCCSAIETARLLLSTPEVLTYANHSDLIGKGYTDHIAASYLVILNKDFEGSDYAAPLERAATIPEPKGAVRTPQQRGGFTIELHGPNPARIYEKEVLEKVGLEPSSHLACFSVNVIGELCNSPSRYVTLANSKDKLGRRNPMISVVWDRETVELATQLEKYAEKIAKELAGSTGRYVKARETLSLGGTGPSHEGSTCYMSADDKPGVTRPNGSIRGLKNIYIADSAIMPSALDCHPTLTVTALALNVADNLIKQMNRGSFFL